ncbi:GGDEF domain-containing protein [Francisella adeliensis]|uniref:GGDEF domain-containing protein n=1 Tax=Francisella adeliensis TaxID=2007306 RepID=A0A2Z4XYM9_9GAMM|nr:GGDEF domain-containing protein [Francisella adeliensis]AXA33981.1 hypothetical protein CDH04_05910 [Francisella adeliensis]MBK2085890.1 GGDEF domain-containing protein [Francisella adeliensis]MBK2097768.1 GGDEF domain-containing protein [Francisella adeliensis]QIW12217.1 GGDEF domain-containing protein [Francisella adeliensis]QIW14093.1 GGDEF domain-containing protein [Francisella adeliensis]
MIIKNKKILVFGELFVLFFSVLVIYGWFSNNYELTRVKQGWPNMQFNTALCFAFLAFSSLLIYIRLFSFGRLLSLFVVVVAALTLIEYSLNTNLYIDTFFYKSSVISDEIYPGRMSPNTAICFLFLAVVNTIKSKQSNSFLDLLYSSSSLAVCCVSLLAMFAYFIGSSTLHNWGQITGMAIHTAICFFILGSINYSRAIDTTKLLKIGEIIATFIFVMFFISWLFFIKYEYSVSNDIINKNAATINLTIKNNIKSRTNTMLRLDSRVNWSAGVNYYFLKNDIDSYLDNFSYLKFIYFNKNGKKYYFSNINISPQQAANIIKLCDSDRSKDYCIKGNNNSFVAVFDESLFKNLVDTTNTEHYNIIVKTPVKVVYSNYNLSSNNYIHEFNYDFSILGQPWSVTVFFDESEYENLLPVFPDLYFMLGFIISFIVLLLFYFADKFANKAKALREREKELEILSSTDVLTKTLNRGAMFELLGLLLKNAKKENSTLTVLYIDIDNFKNVNDTYGHSGGDAVIVEVVSRLQRYLKNKDTISRLGGDEFAVAFANINKEDLIKVLDRIIKLFEAQIEVLQGKFISQTVSIGVSIYNNQNDVTANELMDQADKAMYQAKKSGKNSYYFF